MLSIVTEVSISPVDSIRNKNGQTPAQLASCCGYEECARYLDTAAQRQESDPQGIYQLQPHNPDTVPQPAMTDVTTHKIHPCVINQGINGGKLPPMTNGVSTVNGVNGHENEDCAMEAEDCAMSAGGDGPLVNGHGTTASAADVTLHQGVSTNQVPVAGRKRTREDEDEGDYKRMRTQGNALFTVVGYQCIGYVIMFTVVLEGCDDKETVLDDGK